MTRSLKRCWRGGCLLAAFAVQLPAAGISAQSRELALAGQLELARLVDFAAERAGIRLEYDGKALQGMTVTLRQFESLQPDDLWNVTNQLLASRGFTTVQLPSASHHEPVLSVARLVDAASLARIEPTIPPRTPAGYATIIVTLKHRPTGEVAEMLKPLLSRVGGNINELTNDGMLVLSDLKPRLLQAIDVIAAVDATVSEIVVHMQPVEHVTAMHLAGSLTAAAAACSSMATKPLRGKVAPAADSASLVIIAPEEELATWRNLVSQFDTRQAIETRSYSVRHFTLEDASRLIEQTAKEPGPRGSGDGWRLVQDKLTGLLIVTATPLEHERIAGIVARLNAMPPEARQPVRAFPIRNRSVTEIVDVIAQLIEAGVLEEAEFEPAMPADAAAGRQTSAREVLPPGAAPVGVPTQPAAPTSNAASERSSDSSSTRVKANSRAQKDIVLTADLGTNTLIAVGAPRKLAQLEDLIRTLDMRQPQVMLEVLVLSLNDANTRDLGVELEKIELSGGTVIRLASLFGLGKAGVSTPADLEGRGFSGLILNPGDFRVLIRALETVNKGRTLNIPKLLVNNNQQASLDAVVQQPFVSTNASTTVATTSFGGFESAGTTVTLRPQIAKGDHLVLEYSVALSAFVGESDDPGIPPPRQQNTLQSVVTVPDGFTVALGGIEILTNADSRTQVPFVGDIPLLGEAFRNRSKSASRARFYVFIRPSVLRHETFEDLKYLSVPEVAGASLDDGWPQVKPRIIR